MPKILSSHETEPVRAEPAQRARHLSLLLDAQGFPAEALPDSEVLGPALGRGESLLERIHEDDRSAFALRLRRASCGDHVHPLASRVTPLKGHRRFTFEPVEEGVRVIVRPIKEGELDSLLATAQYEKDWTSMTLQSVCRVQRLAVLGLDPRTVFDCLLREFLRLTNSEYGFIGEVLYSEEKQQKYLRAHAITNIAWDNATRTYYEEHAPKGLEFFNLDTLFGSVIRSGKAVITGDPMRDPRSGGMPDGHPAMRSFMGLPLTDSDGMVGMLGIANGRDGYSESMRAQIEPLLTTAAQLIRVLQARRAHVEAEAELSHSEEARHRLELAHIARVASAGELAASLAHELNQPLCAIVTNARAAQRMQNNNRTEGLHDTLCDIVSDAQRAGGIITRMREFMRKRQVRHEELDINEVILDFVTMLKNVDPIRSSVIETRLAPDLPRVWADKVQIEQVLLNLIRNGQEAMEDLPLDDRRLVVETSMERTTSVSVTVTDEGPGIALEEAERLFDPFYTQKKDGLGMGLPISRTIIEAHGGSLIVANPGQPGARFQFSLVLEAPCL